MLLLRRYYNTLLLLFITIIDAGYWYRPPAQILLFTFIQGFYMRLRKRSFIFQSSYCATLLLYFCQSFATDKIYLKNGDLISGSIIEKVNDTIKIKTKYAGELNIKWKRVQKISLDQNTAITLTDGRQIKAKTIQTDGQTELLLEDGSRLPYATKSISQIGVAKVEKPKDKYTYEGQIKLAADASSGNTDTKHLSLASELIIKNALNRITLNLSSNRATEGDVDILSNSRAAAKYDRFVSKKFYWYVQNSYYEDKFKDLNLQTTYGLGMGRQIFDFPDRKLSVEFGLTQVDEDYITTVDKDYGAGRWSLRYEKQLKTSNKIMVFHKQDGLFDLKNTDDINITSQTGIKVPINSHLDTAFQINIDWDSKPSADRKSTDLIYLLSIGYRWHKQ